MRMRCPSPRRPRRRASRHRRATMKENFIKVQGLRIRTFEEGSGPAVLLLHGASLGSSADVWAGNLADLAAHGLRVIACDQPGFGLSDDPGDFSVAYRTRFVLAFMDALRLPKACLIGHSQSGRIAVSLALEHGERVPGVVVLATGSLLPPVPLRLIYGREDRGHAAERAALAIELHPGLDLHLVDRCKHLVQWDAADEFAALSGSFLAEKM